MPNPQSMKTQYFLSMLSLALAHLVVSSAMTVITGNYGNFANIIPSNLGLLVGVNAIGCHFLFAPIDRFLEGRGDAAAAARRVRHLTTLSVAWGVLLVVGLAFFALVVFGLLCPTCDARRMLPIRLAMVTLFGVFCGTYLYFLIGDYSARLRGCLFEHRGVVLEPAGGSLLHKFVAAFVAVAVVPMSFAFLEALVFGEVRTLQGMTPRQGLLFALVVSVLAACTSFFFIVRNLRRPISSLLESVRRVGEGDLSTKSPVITDDEIGVLACNFNRMVEGLKERQELREIFGKYVPEDVAKAILAGHGRLQPQHRLATILFADLAGFTTLCEQLSPENVVALLNEYFSLVVGIIDSHRGVVNQFQGDALLVTYNVPVEDPNHATAALDTAIAIQQAVSGRTFAGGVTLSVRIGINTGHVVAGPVGAGERLNYTVHGDAVNVAARLEAKNKDLQTDILLSGETRDHAGAGFAFRSLGEIPIRGKRQAVEILTIDR